MESCKLNVCGLFTNPVTCIIFKIVPLLIKTSFHAAPYRSWFSPYKFFTYVDNISSSTPVRGQIKVKNWVYIVFIPRTITSYCPVDID